MATSDTPPIGLDHPTVTPSPDLSPHGRPDRCGCTDCDYTTEIDGDLPVKCPDCGGALTRVLD